MTLPNFIIIGAAKSGTTSIYHYLKQHPEIYMSPVKEPKFFALEGERVNFQGPGDQEEHQSVTTDIESYQTLFKDVTTEKAIGEASTSYLYDPKAPGRIKHYIPNVKLITILRDPVDRAYSCYMMFFRSGREPIPSFREALKMETLRMQNNWEFGWHYMHAGFYYDQLKNYFDIFRQNQIKIYLYEEFSAEPASVVKGMFKYLNVDSLFAPDVSRSYNVAHRILKSNLLTIFIHKPNPVKRLSLLLIPQKLRHYITTEIKNWYFVKPEPPEEMQEIREHLINIYREDIYNLEDLIGRDLSNWLK